MKNCQRFAKLFSDYLEGQISDQLLIELEQHLSECPPCLAIVQRMKALKQQLVKITAVKTSPDFDTVLHARIRVESGLERSKWYERNLGWSVKVPIYATSLAVLIVAVVLIHGEMNKSRSATFSRPISSAVLDSHYTNTKVDPMVYELSSYPIKDLTKPLKEPRLQASKTDTGATKDSGVPLQKNTLTERKVMPASYTF